MIDADCEAGENQSIACDTVKGRCVRTCDEGFADCDGDALNGCEVDLRSDSAHCGACDYVCQPTHNYRPVCSPGSDEAPTCTVDATRCAAGFVDLNGNSDDGCECEITDPDDPIDEEGSDANCDGVPGVLTDSVFVSPNGDDDAHDGLTPEEPLNSISLALQTAADRGRHQVLVAGGTYDGTISLKDGISIYGGFKAEDFTRDIANETTEIITSANSVDAGTTDFITVKANAISGLTTLDHLTIRGADLSVSQAPGSASSYAVWANDSHALTLQNILIFGGHGAPGAAGQDGRTADCTPFNGGAPGAAKDISACAAAGGQHADNGNSGSGAGAGVGGLGGAHSCLPSRSSCVPDIVDGVAGLSGTLGARGSDGLVASSGIGAVNNGYWQPAEATQPTPGIRGSGGGGGGAGGNCEDSVAICGTIIPGNPFCPDKVDVGGNGGKGGNGGCNGTAGQNGKPGGAAFGVFARNSDLTFSATKITVGKGGDGGDGGLGGRGINGTGQTGGERNNGYGGTGGAGGRGGKGGDGGNGVGGCGGPAIGLAYLDSDIDEASLTINQAPGDAGGSSATTQSGAGCEGVLGKTHDFGTTN